ncbi:MAG: alpha-galactosidase, partial [Lachnospiraceae bacterium]|nr:alpha-galactosidase [Lachnospiraceae bacterium]
FTVCDYLYKGSAEEGLCAFRRFFPQKEIRRIFGYTSWYNYYQNINEKIILRDLNALDERFNLFQIDDGYETFVGDWLDVDAKKFPHGLAPIAEAIHKKGYLAGIWLAPFVAEGKSRLFAEKRKWFKTGADGQPIKCGSNWSGFYALDMENAEAKAYVAKCLTHYADMGFDFFKLDFLYAASLPDYDGKTRSQSAEEAYAFLREVLGDKLILGCGATLFNAAGKFDYLRIGPDVSLKFDDEWYMRFMHRERISTKVTLQNTVYRSFMNGSLFGNDPDVFLLRDTNIFLTKEQKRALVTLNALFGSVLMTSDNIAEYDAEKRGALADALELFNGAQVVSFFRRGDVITITYRLNGRTHEIRYDTERGLLL